MASQKTYFQLQLTDPCDVPWEQMTHESKGKFCAQCNKNVLDLTPLTAAEIQQQIEQTYQGFCGRIGPEQLQQVFERAANNFIEKHSHQKRNWASPIALATSLIVAQPNLAQNQQESPVSILLDQTSEANPVKVFENAAEPSHSNHSAAKISGIVRCEETKKPLENVKVQVVFLQHLMVVYTDASGQYHLEIPEHLLDKPFVIRLGFVRVTHQNPDSSLIFDPRYAPKNFTQIPGSHLEIFAKTYLPQTGGIIKVETNRPPVVYYNGKEISWESYQERSSDPRHPFAIHGKPYFQFSGIFAEHLLENPYHKNVILIFDE